MRANAARDAQDNLIYPGYPFILFNLIIVNSNCKIMKRCILLIAALFTLSETFAQEGKRFFTRHGLQQMYIDKNFLLVHHNLNIETVDQMDSLFLVIETSWRKHVDDSLAPKLSHEIPKEVLYNVDSYSYMKSLFSITGRTTHPKNIEFHLLKNYMLPALLKDMNALKEDITLQSHRLIWRGSLENTLMLGSNHYQDKEVIDTLYVLMTELDELLRKSLQSMDEETNRYSLSLFNSLKELEYDIKAKYYFARGQQDKAFEHFINGVSTNQYPVFNILPFSKVLIDYFSENGEQDKAFTLLNNIIFSTSNDEVSRDSLATWYNAVDSVRGAELYQRANQKLGRSLLSISGVTLSSNPTEWNYIANRLPNEKLQKAEYILIDFWYTGCKPCIEEIPALNELHDKLQKRDDIIFISLNTDHFEIKRNKEFTNGTIRKHDIRFPVVFDDDATHLSKELNIRGYPTKMIVNKEGQVFEKSNGSYITLSTFNELLSGKK